MAEPHLPLTQPAPSSSVSARASKRRVTSTPELDFFTPAASSFNPRPYTPHIAPSDASTASATSTRNYGRPLEIHALPPAGMDPQLSDPAVLFIHPPFISFPNSDSYPDGLTYQLMADNPEWFLDADDFMSQHNPNTNAVPYPPHLEPPRGWCPAKKKDLRDRGSEGWPEGEEPRLRCTFCRRTYAGVNAKSMWRRHVFEKHKIAMSNRRDGSERPRGRGSNKENRQHASKSRAESHDNVVNMDVAPQTDPRNVSHKSKFRSLLPVLPEGSKPRRVATRDLGGIPLPISKVSQSEAITSSEASRDNKSSRHHPLSKSHIPPISPPLTPVPSSGSVNLPLERDSSIITSSPAPKQPTVPPSPYDPLLTPSFRHSPPRLPSDQPWRFPSPSHPLHSRSRELSLSMLIRDLNSPAQKGSLIIDGSPRMVQVSPIPNAQITNSSSGKRGVFDLDTPESMARLPRPSPRALFARGRMLAGDYPTRDRVRYRIEESPLHRSSRAHKRSSSEMTDDWLSEVSLTTSTLGVDTSELLTSADPFAAIYSSWGSSGGGHTTTQDDSNSPNTSPEAESPVLRNGALPAGTGLGIGLLGPFVLPSDDLPLVGDSDFDETASGTDEEGDEDEVASFLAERSKHNTVGHVLKTTPPLKKRRLTISN